MRYSSNVNPGLKRDEIDECRSFDEYLKLWIFWKGEKYLVYIFYWFITYVCIVKSGLEHQTIEGNGDFDDHLAEKAMNLVEKC